MSDEENHIITNEEDESRYKSRKPKILRKTRLPNKIIPIHSSDKTSHESWLVPEGRNLANFPFPCRIVMSARPSAGKSCMIKNILLRSSPPYEKVIVCHYGHNESSEYNEIFHEAIDHIPDPKTEIPSDKKKKILIMEDIPLASLNKQDMLKLNRLYGYASSHKHLSIILTAQNPTDCPPSCRRCSNVFLLWRQPDLFAQSMMANRSGLKPEQLHKFFSEHTDYRDSLCIDLIPNSPAPYRLNLFTPVEL